MSLDVYLNSNPCDHCRREGECVFEANITHNLNGMAMAAGMYEALWRPDEHGMTHAAHLVPFLRKGLAWLKEHPDEAKGYNAPNGWGKYEDFVPWVERYLAACEKCPDAHVRVSR